MSEITIRCQAARTAKQPGRSFGFSVGLECVQCACKPPLTFESVRVALRHEPSRLMVLADRYPTQGTHMIRVEALGDVRLSDGWNPDNEGSRTVVESVATSTAFAAFATARGKNLAVHDLIDAVWRGQPTRTARQGVHVQISRMRKMIGELGYDGSAAIEKVSVGYRLDPDVAETDVDLFENHAQLGFTSQRVGARQDALAHFDDALSLWRGEPMAGLPVGPSLSHDRDVLNRLAIDVREARAEVLIQLARAARSFPRSSA